MQPSPSLSALWGTSMLLAALCCFCFILKSSAVWVLLLQQCCFWVAHCLVHSRLSAALILRAVQCSMQKGRPQLLRLALQ